MSNVFSGPAPAAIDVALVEAVELLQADLRALRTHAAEVMDDYRAVCRRAEELATATLATDTADGDAAGGGIVGMAELASGLAEVAAILEDA